MYEYQKRKTVPQKVVQRVIYENGRKNSEIIQGMDDSNRDGRVPFTVVQSGGLWGIGGHLILFTETADDFRACTEQPQEHQPEQQRGKQRGKSRGEQQGQERKMQSFHTKIDLHTAPDSPLDSLDNSSWSKSASSSESTSSNKSSSTGSGIIGKFSVERNARHPGRNLENIIRPGVSLTDAQYTMLCREADSISLNSEYKLIPTGKDHEKRKFNCASVIAYLLDHAGIKVEIGGEDWTEKKYITPARMVGATYTIKNLAQEDD